MKRPDMSLEVQGRDTREHITEIYDYYRRYRQPAALTKFAYGVLNSRYNPVVHYAGDARDQLSDFRRNGTSQVFVFNHLTNTADQNVAASIALQIVPEDIGRTRVVAKDGIFHGLKGRFVDVMGAVPAYRSKDHVTTVQQEWAPTDLTEQQQFVAFATEQLQATTGDMLADGQNVAWFGEGTHNKIDPKKLQLLRPGFASSALHGYAAGADVVITPVGMSFGPTIDSLDPKRAIAVVYPSIYVGPRDDAVSLVNATSENLQVAVLHANNLRESRESARR